MAELELNRQKKSESQRQLSHLKMNEVRKQHIYCRQPIVLISWLFYVIIKTLQIDIKCHVCMFWPFVNWINTCIRIARVALNTDIRNRFTKRCYSMSKLQNWPKIPFFNYFVRQLDVIIIHKSYKLVAWNFKFTIWKSNAPSKWMHWSNSYKLGIWIKRAKTQRSTSVGLRIVAIKKWQLN